MSRWTDVFLGVIALATLATAIVQIAVIVAAGRVARRVERLANQFEQDVKPLFGHLNAIGRDAAHATALATAQVERADKLFSDIGLRVEHVVNGVQATMDVPAREGRALLSAFRAGLQAIRDLRESRRSRQGRGDDEDALFI